MEKRVLSEISYSSSSGKRSYPYDCEIDRFRRKYNRFKNGTIHQRRLILKNLNIPVTQENIDYFDKLTDEQVGRMITYYDRKRRERNGKR